MNWLDVQTIYKYLQLALPEKESLCLLVPEKKIIYYDSGPAIFLLFIFGKLLL